MFNFSRFRRLLGWAVAHSPGWYLFGPALGLLLVGGLLFLLIGADESFAFGGKRVFAFSPYYLRNLLIYGQIISLGAVATHFVSRWFRTDRSAVDTLTLPATSLEKYLLLCFVILVAVPLVGLLSSVVTFGIVRAVFPGIYWSEWQWMWPVFPTAVGFYFLVGIPLLALAILRPRQPLIWALGTIAAGALVAALLASQTSTSNFSYLAGPSPLPAPSDVFGPAWPVGPQFVHPLDPYGIKGFASLFVFALLPAILLLLSTWFTLKNRQL